MTGHGDMAWWWRRGENEKLLTAMNDSSNGNGNRNRDNECDA